MRELRREKVRERPDQDNRPAPTPTQNKKHIHLVTTQKIQCRTNNKSAKTTVKQEQNTTKKQIKQHNEKCTHHITPHHTTSLTTVEKNTPQVPRAATKFFFHKPR